MNILSPHTASFFYNFSYFFVTYFCANESMRIRQKKGGLMVEMGRGGPKDLARRCWHLPSSEYMVFQMLLCAGIKSTFILHAFHN